MTGGPCAPQPSGGARSAFYWWLFIAVVAGIVWLVDTIF